MSYNDRVELCGSQDRTRGYMQSAITKLIDASYENVSEDVGVREEFCKELEKLREQINDLQEKYC